MPRLIVLNGPPGCGKSTLAARYAEDHPLAANLDVDRIRRLIGRWQDDPTASGLLARAMTLAAAREHLKSGHDVVIPQLIARAEFLEELEALATEVGADLREIVLSDDKASAVRRFEQRTEAAAHPSHVEAHEILMRAGGLEQLASMYDRLETLVASRTSAVVIASRHGHVDETYESFVAAL
jgi:predicted kinase